MRAWVKGCRVITGGEAVDPVTANTLRELLPSVLPSAIGAYLHGSAGLGRLRPQSDVDVLVVSRTPLADDQRTRLTDFALRTSGHYPRAHQGPRPIELTVVVRQDVDPWRYPPRCEYLYGEWLRAEIESGSIPDPFDCPDLAVVLSMVLECRAPLFGPEPSSLFGPVPSADLVRAGTDGIADLLRDLEGDTTNVLLTLARVWHTGVAGTITTKDAAASWAARRSHGAVRHVLARARDAYLRGEPHLWGPVNGDVRDAADFLVAAIHDGALSS